MYIIVGLGNPTRKYEKTRHNIGFDAIDLLGEKYQISINQVFGKSLIGKGTIEGKKVILVKPQTYMNLSGKSVAEILSFYKENPAEKLIVLYDDISLDPGNIRVRMKGSAGGHNGIKSIIELIGTQEFPRVKIGVGNKPDRIDLADYVLSHFARAEREEAENSLFKACEAVKYIIQEMPEAAMNQFNTKKNGTIE